MNQISPSMNSTNNGLNQVYNDFIVDLCNTLVISGIRELCKCFNYEGFYVKN